MANPANLINNELSANAAVAQPAAQTIDTNGTVNCAVESQTDRLMIELVNNDDAAATVTIKAGTSAVAHTARDLAVTVAAGAGKVVGPLESARFVKADGSIGLQFQAAAGAPNLSVRIYSLPRRS